MNGSHHAAQSVERRRSAWWLRLVGVVACAVAMVGAADARADDEKLAGYVIRVLDGDTADVIDAAHVVYRVRLAGIDSPEKSQPYGNRSKQALARLIFNRNVVVMWSKHDRYGRIVGKIVLDDGTDVSVRQLREGMAWWYRKYASEQSDDEQKTYEAAENAARTFHLGIWSVAQPQPPWEFRAAAR